VLFANKEILASTLGFSCFPISTNAFETRDVCLVNTSRLFLSANSITIVSVILHLARSVLVHLVQILISIGIQNQNFLFAVSNATRLSRRRWWLKLPVDVFNDPYPITSFCHLHGTIDVFLSFTEAFGWATVSWERLVDRAHIAVCAFALLYFIFNAIISGFAQWYPVNW